MLGGDTAAAAARGFALSIEAMLRAASRETSMEAGTMGGAAQVADPEACAKQACTKYWAMVNIGWCMHLGIVPGLIQLIQYKCAILIR